MITEFEQKQLLIASLSINFKLLNLKGSLKYNSLLETRKLPRSGHV